MPARTPEEALRLIEKGIKAGNLDVLLTLYEPGACIAPKPGQLASGAAGIRQVLESFIAAEGELRLEVKRILQAGEIALVISEWSKTGTRSDGRPINIIRRSADVLRRQPNGTWRFVIDNPWGTD